MSWKELQERQMKWQSKNFPDNDKWECREGMTEEIGEYLEAESSEQECDALADIAIYMLGLCNANGIEFQDIVEYPLTDNDEIKIFGLLTEEYPNFLAVTNGKIAHAFLKRHQKIRNNENHIHKFFYYMKCIFYWAETECERRFGDYYKTVDKVFTTEVEKREWIGEK